MTVFLRDFSMLIFGIFGFLAFWYYGVVPIAQYIIFETKNWFPNVVIFVLVLFCLVTAVFMQIK